MGVDQRVDPRRQKRWTTAHPVHAGRTQCHLLCDQRGDPMAHVANQFPQVAERLSLLASLETPGGVGQNPRWLLLDSRVVGFTDVVQPNCCHPFLLEALLFQWPKKGVVLLGQCLEHKTPESNKSDSGTWESHLSPCATPGK